VGTPDELTDAELTDVAGEGDDLSEPLLGDLISKSSRLLPLASNLNKPF
jgi:hypothetical protein